MSVPFPTALGVKGLEQDRNALLESYAAALPSALDDLEPEERNELYRMLRLEVTPADGGYALSRAFCTPELSSS
jgi:hypothetical protein